MEHLLFSILLQLILIIAAARAGGWLLGKLGQPQVVGEIIAGIVLGPSILGSIAPEVLDSIFTDETEVSVRVLSELGLMLLMFLIGLEFEFSHLLHVGKTAAAVAIAGIVVPFGAGLALASWMHPLVAADVNSLGFVLIVAVALSITAIPILGRIMIELQIQRTRLGALVITAAAIDDACGWTLLAAVSAVLHGHFQFTLVASMLGLTLLFFAGCFFIVRPLIWRSRALLMKGDPAELTLGGLSAVLVLIFTAAIVTNAIGIFSIFGPFVIGAVLSGNSEFRAAVNRRITDFVYAFFLPIFFTFTGLRTDIGSIHTSTEWLILVAVVATAIIGKVAACGWTARLGGMTWRESSCVAIMMNTRALMGLIAINVGLDLGVIPPNVYTMLVVMAIVTTLMTTPLLRRLLKTMKLD